MEKPNIPQKGPYAVEVKKGETYYWCSCGKSLNQPFCNGAHQGTPFVPIAFTAENDETVYLCGCKHTNTPPFCDGAHETLKVDSED